MTPKWWEALVASAHLPSEKGTKHQQQQQEEEGEKEIQEDEQKRKICSMIAGDVENVVRRAKEIVNEENKVKEVHVQTVRFIFAKKKTKTTKKTKQNTTINNKRV